MLYATLLHAQGNGCGARTPGRTDDSISIFYPTGYRYVDPSFKDNDTRLEQLLQAIEHRQPGLRPRIVVYSGASPDGTVEHNNRLSRNRADELADYLLAHTQLPDSLIEKRAAGIFWRELRRLVQTSATPYRDEVLQILDETCLEDTVADADARACKRRLMDLRAGVPYRYMRHHLFPRLRSSAVILQDARPALLPADSLGLPAPATAYTCPAGTPFAETLPPLTDSSRQTGNHQRIYLKTNALGWAMLLMNAAVEWEFCDLFSIHVPVFYSGANYFGRQTKFRFLGTRPELRVWPLREKRFFAGVHFGVASYNLAVSSSRWRIQDHGGHTPALGGGIGVGYRMPFCRDRRFQLEFALGAGAYRARYDKFHNERNGAWHSTVSRTYVGIDNVAVSFSYMFNLKRRK